VTHLDRQRHAQVSLRLAHARSIHMCSARVASRSEP
jgi:hypothetical protein